MPLYDVTYVPGVPKSPECYANEHPERIDDFPEEVQKLLVDPHTLKNHPQDDGWRHELDHDVESVFWLLLYWAMIAQPEGRPGGHISSAIWTSLLETFEARHFLVDRLRSDNPPNLTHSVYKPLWDLISSLAAVLVVDRHWIPESNVRKRPEYMCEAFQRLILEFIISKHDEDFMTCRVGDSLRQVQGVAESQALSTTSSQMRDGKERKFEGAKRRRLSKTEVGRVCAIFELLWFLLLCSQD